MSQISDYPAHIGYMSPEDVERNSSKPGTPDEHALYAAAHCMVSERQEKGELVKMVYALLKREYYAPKV